MDHLVSPGLAREHLRKNRSEVTDRKSWNPLRHLSGTPVQVTRCRWFDPFDTFVHETIRTEIARRIARPVPGRSSRARFPEHADAGQWRAGGLPSARRGSVGWACTSR